MICIGMQVAIRFLMIYCDTIDGEVQAHFYLKGVFFSNGNVVIKKNSVLYQSY